MTCLWLIPRWIASVGHIVALMVLNCAAFCHNLPRHYLWQAAKPIVQPLPSVVHLSCCILFVIALLHPYLPSNHACTSRHHYDDIIHEIQTQSLLIIIFATPAPCLLLSHCSTLLRHTSLIWLINLFPHSHSQQNTNQVRRGIKSFYYVYINGNCNGNPGPI